MIKAKELQNKSRAELEAILVQLRTSLMQFNFGIADAKVKDFSQISKTKRDIARVLTRLAEAPAERAVLRTAK